MLCGKELYISLLHHRMILVDAALCSPSHSLSSWLLILIALHLCDTLYWPVLAGDCWLAEQLNMGIFFLIHDSGVSGVLVAPCVRKDRRAYASCARVSVSYEALASEPEFVDMAFSVFFRSGYWGLSDFTFLLKNEWV